MLLGHTILVLFYSQGLSVCVYIEPDALRHHVHDNNIWIYVQ